MSPDGSGDLAARIDRGVIPGRTTLGELGSLIDADTWLRDSDVVLAEELGGKLPVRRSAEGTVAVVALPGGRDTLYLSLDAVLDAREVASGLRGLAPAAATTIAEAAVVPGG